MSKYLKWYLSGAIIIIILIAIWLFSNYIANQQQTLFVYDFESTTAGGMNALKRFIIKQGFEVTSTDTTIPADNSPLLILISSSSNGLYQPQALISWIKSGGVVIEFAEKTPYLIDLLDEELNQPDLRSFHLPNKKIIHSKHHWFRGLPYQINNKYLSGVTNPDTGFYGYQDTFIIFQQQYGAGKIITWSDPDGLINKNIAQYPNNAVVFGTLIRQLKPNGGTIKIIDLRLTDFRFAKTKPNPLLNANNLKYWVILFSYVFGYLSIILWKLAARFGRPRPLVLAKGRTYDEFVYFLAGLFQQAKASQIVIDNLSAALLKTIIEITGFSPNTPVEHLIGRLEEITNKNYSELKTLFSHLKQPVSQKQFLNVALKLDRYRKELLDWKRFN